MRAAIKIPTSPPPTLPEPERFSADFHSFLAAALVKDFTQRPSASDLLKHPFILKAPPATILAENVKASMAELESKHESMEEIQGLMSNSTMKSKSGGTGQKASMRGVSSTRDGSSVSNSCTLDQLDPSDFDNDVDFSSDTMRAASDTMVVGNIDGTMIPTGANASRALPPAAASDAFDTMVMNGAPSSLSDTVITSATERSGIGSLQQPAAPAPASSFIDDPSEGGLEQFESDDEDDVGDEALGAIKIESQ